jgi:hypothetical protein
MGLIQRTKFCACSLEDCSHQQRLIPGLFPVAFAFLQTCTLLIHILTLITSLDEIATNYLTEIWFSDLLIMTHSPTPLGSRASLLLTHGGQCFWPSKISTGSRSGALTPPNLTEAWTHRSYFRSEEWRCVDHMSLSSRLILQSHRRCALRHVSN